MEKPGVTFNKQRWKSKVLENNALFIHIPKCAGTSIQKALLGWNFMEFDDEHKLWAQHATASEIKKYYLSEQEWEKLFTFAFVRNPFDRAVSSYNYLCNLKNIEKNKKSFSDFVFRGGAFKDLLSKDACQKQENRYHHVVPMVDYLFEGEQLLVDYVARFEDLALEWGILCKKMASKRKLPFLNKHPHPHYSSFYDEVTRKQVAKDYARDLEVFAYKFESPAR